MGFAIDSFNKCKSCQFFIPNCDYCTDNSSCYMCKPAYFIYNGQCKTCQQLIPDCNACVSNTTCKTCNQGFIYDLGTCLDCGNLINYCGQCVSKTQCRQCIDPYTVDQNKKCKCKSPLYNVSDLCIDDPHCVSVYKIGQYVKCSFCDLTKLYVLNAYGRCVCKKGYQEVNSICTQICGDGIIFKHQCDDNNTFNGDGCSQNCLIEKDYVCTKLISGMSNCKLNKSIEFKLDHTDKMLTENKALIYISLNTQNSNVQKFYESMFFNYTLLSNRTDTIKILSTKKNQKGQIVIEVQYNQTIQDTYMQLAFIYPKQKLISPDFYLKFQLKGNNYPLIISGYNEKYEQISKIQVNFIICSYVMVILILLQDKFIAVEAINTFQMIFFSLLLIYNNKSWPQAFSTVLPLKYSTGFNQLIYEEKSFTNLMDLTFNKYRYVGMCEYFLLNNFTNSAIFILELTIFIILFFVKTKIQRDIFLTKESKLQEQLEKKLEKFSKVFKKFFNITFNFSYIMIFQILISLYIETAYLKNVSTFMLVLSKFSALLSFTAIIVTILQNFNHLFLTPLDSIAQNFKVGLVQARYKRVYFIYILINGFSIVLLNNKLIFGLSTSIYLLIAAVMYLIFLICYRPYRYSFAVHGFTIVISQLIFVITLSFINLINLNISLDEFYLLAFCYVLMGFCVLIVFLAIIRVYLDCKYGSDQIEMEINNQRNYLKQKEQKRFYIQQIIDQKQPTKQIQKKRIKINNNKYIYQNQLLENQQNQYLNELKNKKFLSEWQKDLAYYRVYKQKPMKWVQQNQRQQKYQYLLKKQLQRHEKDVEEQNMKKRKQQKVEDKTYMDDLQQIKQKLRVEYHMKKQKKKQVKINKKQRDKQQKQGENKCNDKI